MNLSNVNHAVDYLVFAYKQAPWRIQRQWLGTFLLAVLGIAMVAALYLDVTAHAAIAGRQIQDMSIEVIGVQHANGDLQTKLAELTSSTSMEQRAQKLGYTAIDPSQMQYVLVPGYVAPTPDILAAAPALMPSAPSIPPGYTESLIDWLNRGLRTPGISSVTGISQ
jgi:hypothetical protein